MSGGGADLIVERIESDTRPMATVVDLPIGRAIRAGSDEAFIRPARWDAALSKAGVPIRQLLIGENVRDWGESAPDLVIYPYVDGSASSTVDDDLWPLRTMLAMMLELDESSLAESRTSTAGAPTG